PSPMCAETTARTLGIHAETGTLSSPPPELGHFDGVLLSHVLEHVQELREAAEAIRGLTRDGGLVYVEVPDATRYGDHVAAPFQDFNTEHINHFSLQSLTNLMTSAGFVRASHGTKTLMGPPPIPYPAVFSFFRKTAVGPAAPVKDVELREKINGY